MQNLCDSMYSKQTGSERLAIAPLHQSHFRAGKIVINDVEISVEEMMQQIAENPDAREKYLRELTKSFTGIEKPLKNAKIPATLDELISELHEVFSSDRVNIEYVNHLMLSYESNPQEWRKFAKFDRYKYTRNLVDAGNDRFNLMILCWGEGHASPIHDHSDSHCFMKMLKGELCEIRYAWPTDTDNNNEYGGEMNEISRSIMETNSVRYINDTMGLHRVENPSMVDGAVSLHLYCPPYNSCSMFHLKTGKQTKCNVEFYSKFGHRRLKNVEDAAPSGN